MDTATQKLSPAGQFYRTRDSWIKFILCKPKDEYTYVEKLVAIRIASTINPKTQTWVLSQGRIAKDLGCGVRIVKSAVAKLKEEKLIKAKRVRVPGQTKLFNAYELVPVELSGPF
jgi:transcription initiation factor IIE alpha subunit